MHFQTIQVKDKFTFDSPSNGLQFHEIKEDESSGLEEIIVDNIGLSQI